MDHFEGIVEASQYLLYFLRAMTLEFDRLTQGGSVHRMICMPDVVRFVLPMLPRYEQRAIVATLRADLSHLDGLARRIREQATRLREYRQTLISAAVAGHFNVSSEVAA